MIISKSLKSIYAKHRDEIIDMVYHDQVKPAQLAKTSFVYMDKKGRKYNHYEKDGDLPLERYGKVLEYIQYISKGLSASEDERLDEEIAAALELGLKNDKEKAAVTIGAILNEKRKRRTLCIHTELIYNYLAVQWIREDENPSVFDNEVQMEKVETLKEENKEDVVSFFFQQSELKRLRDLLAMSREDWERYTSEYLIQVQRFQELLRLTASKKLSKQAEKISVK